MPSTPPPRTFHPSSPPFRRRFPLPAPPADEETIPHALDDAMPTWVDRRKARYGMPEFLWREFQEAFPAATVRALGHRPEFVEAAVVAVWRRWRRRWLAGEWSGRVAP